jgi:hypothetical protein
MLRFNNLICLLVRNGIRNKLSTYRERLCRSVYTRRIFVDRVAGKLVMRRRKTATKKKNSFRRALRKAFSKRFIFLSRNLSMHIRTFGIRTGSYIKRASLASVSYESTNSNVPYSLRANYIRKRQKKICGTELRVRNLLSMRHLIKAMNANNNKEVSKSKTNKHSIERGHNAIGHIRLHRRIHEDVYSTKISPRKYLLSIRK